jgi:hypothetical protein
VLVVVTVGTVNLDHMECRDTQISCIATRSLAEPLELCRPKEGLEYIAPKHPEALGRAIKRAPLKEAFIPIVKSMVSRACWQSYNHTPTLEGHASKGHNHTEVSQDLSIMARRPQGGRFGAQMTNIAAGHPAEL